MAIHGAGQDEPAFKNYTNLFNDTPPAIYMVYTSLKLLNSSNGQYFFPNLSMHLRSHTQFLIPQIGFSMTHGKNGSYEDKAAVR